MRYVFILFFLINCQAYGQVIRIPGQVLDIRKNPISQSNVSIVGENASAVTDDAGLFSLLLPQKIKKGDLITLRVSKDGYISSTRQVSVSYLITIIILKRNYKGSMSKIAKPKQEVIAPANSVPTVTVTSIGQSGGITANQVTLEPPKRNVDSGLIIDLINHLPNKSEKIKVSYLVGDADAYQFAVQIIQALANNGYTNIDKLSAAIYSPPIVGQAFSRDSTGVKINIGSGR